MWVVQFDEYGPPEVLHLATMETPMAGAAQVQIRVAAAGANPVDFKLRSGSIQQWKPVSLPHVVGLDVAGTVTAIGPDVTRFKTGDRVVASVASGAYAEFAVADETACAHLPVGFDFGQAAALPCAALTGVQLIEEGVRPKKGQTVLITGATGSVGRFSVMAAVALGAHVVAAVRPSYFDEARKLGAKEVVSLEGDDIRELSFDYVADTVGGPAVASLCRYVAPGRPIITVTSIPIDPELLPMPPKLFRFHADGARLARLVEDVAHGVITMPIANRLPFTAAAEAHRLMEAGGAGGKIILQQ